MENTQNNDLMITIVTQCSMDRLYLLKYVASNWNGIISLAIYIKMEESLIDIQTKINAFFNDIESNTDTILDIHLLFEISFGDDNNGIDQLYPINHLRNVALQCAKSEFILLTDSDFVPSSNFHKNAINDYYKSLEIVAKYKYRNGDYRGYHQILKSLNESNKIALIFPAFELNLDKDLEYKYQIESISELPLTKKEVSKSYLDDKSRGFHINRCLECHKPTNYKYWMDNNTENDPYLIKYMDGYEPYILMKRVGIHRYDARFRGYGYNKIFHLYSLNEYDNISWMISKSSFLYHIPHQKSKDRDSFIKQRYNKHWIAGLYRLASTDLIKRNDAAGYIIK